MLLLHLLTYIDSKRLKEYYLHERMNNNPIPTWLQLLSWHVYECMFVCMCSVRQAHLRTKKRPWSKENDTEDKAFQCHLLLCIREYLHSACNYLTKPLLFVITTFSRRLNCWLIVMKWVLGMFAIAVKIFCRRDATVLCRYLLEAHSSTPQT